MIAFCVQPCELYYTKKTAIQRLFVAAAALYWFTGDASWRIAADNWYAETADKSLFYSNWDNTVAQGVAIMASNPFMDQEVAGATPRARWQTLLRNGAKLWSDCSNDGAKGDFCKCAPRSVLGFADSVLHSETVLNGTRFSHMRARAVHRPESSHTHAEPHVRVCRRTPDGKAYPVDIPWCALNEHIRLLSRTVA